MPRKLDCSGLPAVVALLKVRRALAEMKEHETLIASRAPAELEAVVPSILARERAELIQEVSAIDSYSCILRKLPASVPLEEPKPMLELKF